MFSIELPQFQGPFDLLLFFIHRDELDIYDIPIHQITTDFLNYIHNLRQLNLDVAAEFINMAATLINIKSKMLLPHTPKNEALEEDNFEEDPRDALVKQLLEYKKFKEMSAKLEEQESKALMQVPITLSDEALREISNEFNSELELEHLTISKLVIAYQSLIKRKFEAENIVSHEIATIKFDIALEKEEILTILNESSNQLSFDAVFQSAISKIQCIYRFLAMLELIQEKIISIKMTDDYNGFYIARKIQSTENE
jgi:segregation and condensation protein A